MGIACIFLKNRIEYNAKKTVNDIVKCSDFLKLDLTFSSKLESSDYDDNATYGNITYNNELEFVIDVSSTNDIHEQVIHHGFDKFDSNQELRFIFEINYDEGLEKQLLEFVFEYLKLNPRDYVWFEDEWAYSYEDVKKIRQGDFDDEWCYKPVTME